MTRAASSRTAGIDALQLREEFPILQQRIHRDKPLIYFDNAASCQRPARVIEAMRDCYERHYANVHRGTHWLSEEASRLYEEARYRVQQFIGAKWNEEVIFTGGTTAAVNLVARAWGDANIRDGDEILLTLMEHHSNIVPWQQLAERRGARVRFAGLTPDGQLDIEDFERKLTDRTRLVAFTAVSNTLGTINPVAMLTEKAHDTGAVVVVDAAQHVPHAATSVTEWDADFVCFSAHKLPGPSGIGVLYGKKELLEAMPPFMGGGGMISAVTVDGFTPGALPAKLEAGTPPIVEAVGLGAAVEWLNEHVQMDQVLAHEQLLAAHARHRLAAIDGVTLLGPSADLTCGIVSFHVPGISAQDIAVFLDLQGVAIRAGHHCTMPLHTHLGISASCRASFYLFNTLEEVDWMADRLAEILPRLK